VFTESLGSQRHHDNVALLVNEHSASAAEMVAAFASEYNLTTLVGTKTAGRLVATSAFKVGFGYRVVMPVATYFTWHGANLEGRGLAPTIEEPFSFEASVQGRDNQLERATQFLRDGERFAAAGASAYSHLTNGRHRLTPSATSWIGQHCATTR
jgi:carboxyl-terminal processing protease